MAYREVTMLEVKEVLRLWLRRVPKKRIAIQRGLDPKTVRRQVELAQECGLRREAGEAALTDELLVVLAEKLRPALVYPKGEGWRRCEEQRAFIQGHLERRVKLSKIRKLLRRQGVQISYPSLWRFATIELGFGRQGGTVPVADCAAGEEVQLDTGWVGWIEPDLIGRRRRFKAWIFTSVRTRYRFVYPVLRETTESAIEACEAAWTFFGGIFKSVVVDNTKAIVHTADPLHPRLVDGFVEYSQARGFVIDTARVRHPKDKARVERAVQTVRDDCFGGERLRSIEQAAEHARRWSEEEYGLRRHSTTQRLPREHFEAEERAVLLPPPQGRYDVPLWSTPRVGRDFHAQVAKALYSLPYAYRGRVLRARADSHTVRFYDGQKLLKTHPRQSPGQRSTDARDLPPEKAIYAQRDTAALTARAAEHGEAVARFAKALLSGPGIWTRMRQVYALLSLARRFGSSRLDEACRLALEVDLLNVYRLRRMLESAPAPSSSNHARVIPIARYLRPAHQYALPLAQSEHIDKENSHDH
jgi:transposase